jgi:N-methylhydantoinase A
VLLYNTESGDTLVHKVHSTPDDPGRALVDGLGEVVSAAGLTPADVDAVFHATTIATNAVLEHRRARRGLVTRGFRDVVHIGRHQRAPHYSIMQDIPWQTRPFVERRHRKVVTERMVPPGGEVLVPLAEDDIRLAARELRAEGVEAVAVCFLFSYLDPEHERRAAAILREELPDAFVTSSSDFPQFREFEQFTTTRMNAFVGPGTGRYLERLSAALEAHGVRGELHVMMSNRHGYRL